MCINICITHKKQHNFCTNKTINMFMLTLVLLLKFISVTFAILEDQHEDVQPKFMTPCTTPNRDVGVCVEIQKCPIFMDAFATSKSDNYDFIRASRCGPPNEDMRQPKVCCGMYDDYLDKVPATTFTTTERVTTPSMGLFPKNCRTQFDHQRVFGGKEAQLGEYPWMARLRHRRSDGLFSYGCAGFLISEKFVLTAAHCVRSKALEPLGPIYHVQVGEHNTETDPDCMRYGEVEECADTPQLLRVVEPIVHSEYTGNFQQYNDIALIPLKEPAKFTDWVSPLCLPKTLSQAPHMLVSGWGKTEAHHTSHIKLKVSLPRINKTRCVSSYRPIGIKLLDSQLCAGGEAGSDSCSGDSGGPLMVYQPESGWHAEGIVSFGKGCGLEGWPGVYTSIPYFMPWIEMVVGGYLEKHAEKITDSGTSLVEGDNYIWNK